jgi:hypothetical protein
MCRFPVSAPSLSPEEGLGRAELSQPPLEYASLGVVDQCQRTALSQSERSCSASKTRSPPRNRA